MARLNKNLAVAWCKIRKFCTTGVTDQLADRCSTAQIISKIDYFNINNQIY